jgi:putative DNA primase/helicase
MRVVRALIDPNHAPIRVFPKTERELFISARQEWLHAYDNLSALAIWASDALCRLATGGGFAARKLFTDHEEIIFEATRPVIINGIEDVVTRGDLLDRSILLQPPRLSDTQRKYEKQLWREFEEARPRILGAVLDAVSQALRDLETVTLTARPRMADFARWSCAAAPALGWTAEQFLQAYNHNIQSANDLVLDASPVAQAVLQLLEHHGVWEGTATQLLSVLTPLLEGTPR